MNKDLDSRLIRKGEYRSATNVQVVSTGTNSSGTVQNIMGTTSIGGVPVEAWNNLGTNKKPKCVASIADEKNDKAYFFFASEEKSLADISSSTLQQYFPRFYFDTIIEQDLVTNQTTPVVVDVFKIVYVRGEFFDTSTFNLPAQGWTTFKCKPNITKYLRKGMTINMLNNIGVSIIKSKIKAIDGDNVLLTEEQTVFVGPNSAAHIVIESDRVLNFKSTWEEGKSNFITGLNIIDDLLFWTDNYSEPKKINIERCKQGTNINGVLNDFKTQTILYIDDPIDDGFVDVSTVDNELDSGSPTNGSIINNYLKEEHITVIRKAPTKAPSLSMKNAVRENTTNIIVDYIFVDGNVDDSLNFGDIKIITSDNLLQSNFRPDDLLTITEETDENAVVLKAKFIGYLKLGLEAGDKPVPTLSITDTIKIEIITDLTASIDNIEWNISIDQPPPLFETKLGRFGYRYKYTDGEYSSFSPWSELAFIPDNFDYTAKKGHNLGMVNSIRELIVKDFIPYKKPLDVTSIDILFKATDSPSVYIVKTINKNKDSEWELFTPDGEVDTIDIKTGELSITSEMVHRVLPASQTLRSWDNVPRYALAQEIVGNRLLYANYTQGYELGGPINIDQVVISNNEANEYNPKKSLKTLRDYKIGLVYGDKYGRETPVVTSGYTMTNEVDGTSSSLTGDISLPKDLCAMSNSFQVSQSWGTENIGANPPEWIEYVKYYVKETSNEYYNLIMDRWYDAGDGNIWISFNSADRNKVDEETYLILKNENGSNSPVLDEARYKILAIKDEAPDSIKTVSVPIGEIPIGNVLPSTTGTSIWATGSDASYGTPTELYKNTKLTITSPTWSSSGIGNGNPASPLDVFNTKDKGNIRIRIVGTSGTATDDLGNITGGVIKSEWRTLSNFSKSTDSTGDDQVILNWNKKFIKNDVDMLSRFQSLENLTDSIYDSSSLLYSIEFEQDKKIEGARFDAKFFVKIQKDVVASQSVANDSNSPFEYITDNIFEFSYIEASYENGEEMDVNPSSLSIDYQASFTAGGSSSTGWFNGVFTGIIGVTQEEDFATAGSNTDYDQQVEGVGSQYGIPPALLYHITEFPQAEYSAIGSPFVNLNLATRDFWDNYEQHNDVSSDRVFIDGINVANTMRLERRIDNPDLPETIIGNHTITNDGNISKIDPFMTGFMSIPNSNVVGASDGTYGCMVLSYNSLEPKLNGNQSLASGQEITGGINPLIEKLKPGQLFQFSDNTIDTDGNKVVYSVLGVPYSSFDSGTLANRNFFPDPITVYDDDIYENNPQIYNQVNNQITDGKARRTAIIEFRRINVNTGALLTQGLDASEFDPRAYLHHDGRDTRSIMLVSKEFSTLEDESTESELGSCWETEPKKDSDVDLYYEASSAVPMFLSQNNAFDFAPINSKVSIKRQLESIPLEDEDPINKSLVPVKLNLPVEVNVVADVEQVQNPSDETINHRVNNIHFAETKIEGSELIKESVVVSIVATNSNEDSSDFGVESLYAKNIGVNDIVLFEHPDGTITRSKILNYYTPSNNNGIFGGTLTESDELIGINTGQFSFKKVEDSEKTFIYNEGILSCLVGTTSPPQVGDYVSSVKFVNSEGVLVSLVIPDGVMVTSLTYTSAVDTNVYTFSYPNSFFLSNLPSGVSEVFIFYKKPTGYYEIEKEVWHQPVVLPWHNCYSFGNGVESDRIRDDFNAPQIDNGVKVSTTFSGYKKETIGSGLIYSGLYNSTSQVNDLNEFNMSEKITKELNPSHGSIQALKTRNSDVVVLAEDKVLKITANKDALFNADGNPQLLASNRVLGTAIPFVGDYGISKNPESLASDQYRLYFTDKQRGAVLRLSRDGLTPISDVGMQNWFRSNLKNADGILGTFDDISNEYNVSLTGGVFSNNANNGVTVSFSEQSKGWVSFKSFVPSSGISSNSQYLTTYNENIYKHHSSSVYNTFYDKPFAESSLLTYFNEAPGTIKSFKSLSYEGTESRVIQFNSITSEFYDGNLTFVDGQAVAATQDTSNFNDNQYYNQQGRDGWYVSGLTTDLESGKVDEFIQKEGKYFNYIKGIKLNEDIVDTSSFTVQGIGQISVDAEWFDEGNNNTSTCSPPCGDGETCVEGTCVPIVYNVTGCTDVTACNYNSNATIDATPTMCIYNCQGCTDPLSSNYDPQATIDDGSCLAYQIGCMDPLALNSCNECTIDGAWDNGVEGGTFVEIQFFSCEYEGTQIEVPGCMDALACNYNENATFNPSESDAIIECNYETLSSIIGEDQAEQFILQNCCVLPGDPLYSTLPNCQNASDYGCTDSTACNYDSLAIIDDESCVYIDPNNQGFIDCDGNCEDGFVFVPALGVCKEEIVGCMDELACNYDSFANIENTNLINNGCTYTLGPGFECDGTCKDGYTLIGSLDPLVGDECIPDPGTPITGCLDATAFNYNCATGYESPGWVGTPYENIFDEAQANLNPWNPGLGWSNGGATSLFGDGWYGCNLNETYGTPYGTVTQPQVTVDDGSCIPVVFGCMDATFQPNTLVEGYPGGPQYLYNYNPEANVHAVSAFDGSDPCVVDPLLPVYGCMDTGSLLIDNGDPFDSPYPGYPATNYNQFANINETSSTNTANPCSYISVNMGCTDPLAVNYESNAVVDNGSCYYLAGCTDPNACNYNENADSDDGSCVEYGAVIEGCTSPLAYNYDPCASDDDGSCGFDGIEDDCGVLVYPTGFALGFFTGIYVAPEDTPEWNASCSGCMDPAMQNYDASATIDDGSCNGVIEGCTNPNAINYNSLANVDNGSCVVEVDGCTDPSAFNYDSAANVDDGSCYAIVEGCMDIYALNFNITSTNESGTLLGQGIDVNTQDDSCIEVVFGCLDPTAENFNPLANTSTELQSQMGSYYDSFTPGEDCYYNTITLTFQNYGDDVITINPSNTGVDGGAVDGNNTTGAVDPMTGLPITDGTDCVDGISITTGESC